MADKKLMLVSGDMAIAFLNSDIIPYVLMNGLAGLTVDLEIPENTGYPAEAVAIVRVDPDGDVVVCETDESGAPIENGGTWAIPQHLIRTIMVL